MLSSCNGVSTGLLTSTGFSGNLTGTFPLDFYAILFMVIIMTLFIYKTLKNKDSVTIN